MANELTVSANLAFAKNNASVAFGGTGILKTVAGDRYIRTIQSIGITEEAIGKGELGTLGYGCFRNLDVTNFITIRAATALATGIKLEPGDFAVFRLGGNAPFAIADTGACLMEYLMVEE